MFAPMRTATFAAALLVAADSVPSFDVAPVCRDVAAKAAPIGKVDICLHKENEARDQLAREWTDFTPGEKSGCLELVTAPGDPTYTSLLACLELRREARKVREAGRPRRRERP
jgi:hypothetical protein